MTTPDSNIPRVENKEGFGRRILLADDEESVREPIKRFLIRLGYTVETVVDGQSVLNELATGKKYDLIFADRNMPGMTGVEVLQQIRYSNEPYNRIPVIVYTADTGDEDIKIIGQLANGYLKKPAELEEIRNAIKKAIEGGGGEI